MSGANPYQNVGQPARGKRFVGREDLVARLRGVVASGRPSNMSIIGNHRMGKTSLVYHSLLDNPLERSDVAVVIVGVGKITRIEDLFRLIGRQTVAALGDRLPVSDRPGVAATLAALEGATDWYEIFNTFMQLFSTIRRCDLAVLVVLDEFDRINLTGAQTAHFQLMRDLCTEDWSSAGLVTVSRQRVKTLEIGAAGGSCLDQVLVPPTFIGLFQSVEQLAVLRRAGAVGVDLEALDRRITALTGRHPYLLELLCYELVEGALAHRRIDIDAAYRNVRAAFAGYFARLIKIIDTDLAGSGVDKLYQVVDGVGLSVSVDDVLALLQYGLVVEDSDHTLVPFSEEFGHYLLSIADGRDFRSLWLDCEVGLRRLIRSVLGAAAEGKDCLDLLPPSMKRSVDSARDRQRRGAALSDAPLDVVDYLYPGDLFQIIVVRWDLFGPVLGGTYQLWQNRGEAVTRARNEVMHIRPIPGGVRVPAQNAALAIVDTLRRLGHVEATVGTGGLSR